MQVTIRPEQVGDETAIHDLIERAFASMPFAGGDEQLLPARFRNGGIVALSLVALLEERIVGQLTLTPAIAADGLSGWFALGPISVEPDLQKHGIGSMLLQKAISWMKDQNAAGCALVGSPDYYRRFGWKPFPTLVPEGEPAEYYQILPLGVAEPKTVVGFHPLFYGEL